MKHVAIIGGGLAGLSAGVELAARGVRVTVVEARPHLGGRAYSFRDEESGEVVDNGQHAMMGCYRHTLAFLDRIGASPKLARQDNLRVAMIHKQRGAGAIVGAPLPSPLHMLSGVLRYGLLGRSERLQALLGGARLMAMRRRSDARLGVLTVEQALIGLGQSENARQCFWYPVAIATLNELPERACVAPFAEVLARAFFGSRADSQFVLPKVGLSDLYTPDARRFIESRGGTIATKASVAELGLSDGSCTSIRLRDGRSIAVDGCIAAVPPRALHAIAPQLNGWGELATTPIVSVHLWYDRSILSEDFTGLIGTTTQWLFDRTRLMQAEAHTHCVSAVISAAHEVCDQPVDEIATKVIHEIAGCVPAARSALVRRTVVIKEKQATISLTPAAERRRPRAQTAIHNLFLAGDWIQTGLPATIESAVLSGRNAALLVADRMQPQ